MTRKKVRFYGKKKGNEKITNEFIKKRSEFIAQNRNFISLDETSFSRSTDLPEETMENKFLLKKVEGNDLIKKRIRKVNRCKKKAGKEKHKSSYSIVKR